MDDRWRWRGPFRRVAWTPYAAGVAGVAVLLGLLAAASIHRERVRQYEQASAQTATLAHLLEASVDGMLGEIDALLASLAAQASDGLRPSDVPTLRRMMASTLATTPEVARWTLCNEGHAPLHTGGDAALPDGCSDALTTSRTGLQLAGPLRRAPQAPWILAFSRPWQNPTTGERGRIVAELPVERFERVFGELRLGSEGAATLRTGQLALVYRHPWRAGEADHVGDRQVSQRLREQLQQAPEAGVYQTVTAIDQVERLNAYRRLRGYPFYVLVGFPARDHPRGWNGMDLAVIALAGATLLIAAFAAVALYRTSQRRVAAATRRVDALVASSNDAIISKTLHGTVTSWNAAAERIFGWRADEMIGHSIRRLYPPDFEHEEDGILEQVRRGEWVQHFDTERLRANGRRIAVSVTISPLLDPAGRIVGASMIARDISRQKALEAELRALAFHDALTQLPNRRLFLDRLRHAQEASRRSRSHGGVLFVDLDHFKHLNDTHGHDVGDLMLREVARRLRATVRAHDTVARLGGDEFVVLCEQLGQDGAMAERALRRMADKLSRVLTDDFRLGPVAWPYGASIGLRMFLATDEDPEALLRDADRAMYLDKERRHTESGLITERGTLPGAGDGGVDIAL
jgi:diguanylate cyclase (GGDEF)-like protein/PAS domain S-box-containing protein